MGRACVMIVEDEPLIRMMLADQLREDAFLVVEAENADQAVCLLIKEPAVKAVITDVRMPGSMDGLELAQRISAEWPKLKVFITSGHFRAGDAALPSDVAFVPKPYRPHTFTKLLREALH